MLMSTTREGDQAIAHLVLVATVVKHMIRPVYASLWRQPTLRRMGCVGTEGVALGHAIVSLIVVFFKTLFLVRMRRMPENGSI